MSQNNKQKIFVYFQGGRQKAVILTNSPWSEPTHWRQTFCIFEEPVMVEFKKRSIKGKFKLSPESEFSRGIKIEIKLDKSCVLASKLNYDFVLPG